MTAPHSYLKCVNITAPQQNASQVLYPAILWALKSLNNFDLHSSDLRDEMCLKLRKLRLSAEPCVCAELCHCTEQLLAFDRCLPVAAADSCLQLADSLSKQLLYCGVTLGARTPLQTHPISFRSGDRYCEWSLTYSSVESIPSAASPAVDITSADLCLVK